MIDLIEKLPLWLKNHILRYYICNLTASDLIKLYVSGLEELVNILEQLSAQEWLKIYRTDHKMKSAGGNHSLAITSNGNIVAWGSNHHGQSSIPNSPKDIHYLSVSAGDNHSLALRSDGQILAWGDDGFDQCTLTRSTMLPKGTCYITISAGATHSLAIRSDGQIVAWGNDINGQCIRIPILPDLPKGTLYTSIVAGGYDNLALRSDGQFLGWVYDPYGQCTNITLLPKDTDNLYHSWRNNMLAMRKRW